jgi:hypothetical protein
MASQNGINGVAIAVVLGGAVLAYSGVKGRKVSSIVRDLLSGKVPTGEADSSLAIPSNAQYGTTPAGAAPTPSGTFTPGGTTSQTITNYFRAKGLNDIAIAAILGRWQIESGLNPSGPGAWNPAENAYGLAQWEGGRRVALQEFARSRGTTESDLMTQLDFAWMELNGPYNGVLLQLRGATNVADTYHYFTAHYEVASGLIPEGLAAAEHWYNQLKAGTVSV